jgi:hypothetical protein
LSEVEMMSKTSLFLTYVVALLLSPAVSTAASAGPSIASNMSCTLDLHYRRWHPGPIKSIHGIYGTPNGRSARYGGTYRKAVVSIADIMCDSRVLEITVITPIEDDFEGAFSTMKLMESLGKVSSAEKLTNAQKVSLSNTNAVVLTSGDVSATYSLSKTDSSIILNLFYRESP